jgi:6-phosphogluconate dehydrogenase
MAGGDKKAYAALAPWLRAVAARTKDGPCCALLGPGGAGHFTKMVHNGIEYAFMQALAEAYSVMDSAMGLEQKEIAKIFAKWNQGKLKSYLVEISTAVLKKQDTHTHGPLLPLIADEGEQKGTGKWTCQAALDLGIPVPSISAAVEARFISALKPERTVLAQNLDNPGGSLMGSQAALIKGLADLVWLSQLATFCQGLHLLWAASAEYGFDIDLAEVLRIWKGGCIIRSAMLDPLRKLFLKQTNLAHPLFHPAFAKSLNAGLKNAFQASLAAKSSGLSLSCLDASLNYILALSTARLPANLIQAQRDYFGAHTYRRIDKEGVFHTSW